MVKKFILTRNLKAGMQGEDVRTLQKWLNIVNARSSFSECFPNGVPENGLFQTFILGVFYHEYLKLIGYPTNHVYDQEIHEILCKHVNSDLFWNAFDKSPNGVETDKIVQWDTQPYSPSDTQTWGF